jgi:hypothetical protein
VRLVELGLVRLRPKYARYRYRRWEGLVVVRDPHRVESTPSPIVRVLVDPPPNPATSVAAASTTVVTTRYDATGPSATSRGQATTRYHHRRGGALLLLMGRRRGRRRGCYEGRGRRRLVVAVIAGWEKAEHRESFPIPTYVVQAQSLVIGQARVEILLVIVILVILVNFVHVVHVVVVAVVFGRRRRAIIVLVASCIAIIYATHPPYRIAILLP